LRQQIWDALAPLRSPQGRDQFPVKWVRPENIHLSLKFLGDVDEARGGELQSALRRAAGGGGGGGSEPRSLALQVTGFGVFPDYRRPNVLWAGVTPDPALELLQHRVEQEFAPLGFPSEGRPFRPHVTLGRTNRDARPRDFAGLEGEFAKISLDETVSIGELDLMQSTLRPEGPVYQVKYHERLL
jgi:2'-5' RNA ligase